MACSPLYEGVITVMSAVFARRYAWKNASVDR
jgi:hypothetical protein